MSVVAQRLSVPLFCAFALLLGLGQVDAVWPLRAVRAVTGSLLWTVDWTLLGKPGASNVEYSFQSRETGAWVELPMAEWYPARWDGRLRWERERLEESERVRTPFLVAACARSGAREVRLVRRRWPRQPGHAVQTRAGLTEKVLDARSCALPPPDSPRISL